MPMTMTIARMPPWSAASALCAVMLASVACTSAPTPSVPTRILSPAPAVEKGVLHDCPFGPPRASTVAARSLDGVMQDHIPRWLPAGMGLVEAFGPGEGSLGGAYFADGTCREIQLWFWESSDSGSGETMGSWRVEASGPRGCGNAVLGSGACIDYHARVDGGSIGVQMMGVPRSQGDRVVQSIPL
jgi:hypothetical protein